MLRRSYGYLNFNRDWNDYVRGFGDESAEFWLGLDNLHRYTSPSGVTLWVAYGFRNRRFKFVKYDRIYVAGQEEQYKLTVSGFHALHPPGEDALLNVSIDCV